MMILNTLLQEQLMQSALFVNNESPIYTKKCILNTLYDVIEKINQYEIRALTLYVMLEQLLGLIPHSSSAILSSAKDRRAKISIPYDTNLYTTAVSWRQ